MKEMDLILTALSEWSPAHYGGFRVNPDAPVIDANKLTMDWLAKAGPDASTAFFTHLKPGEFSGYPKGAKDNSHFREKGAEAVARMIAEDAKQQKLDIAKCFK